MAQNFLQKIQNFSKSNETNFKKFIIKVFLMGIESNERSERVRRIESSPRP